ncbi:hypothetical protein C9374_012102 [Naegleria lovaniensis]|uniref:F-box domain-containing protein n=1 Tax=Naegleria lovaniensis TaxID=51637 RepID=A0AA88GDM4_NAELO|nr:uncharacterized protein C9374_012102 [Naegleria lovaniensis]KAG2373495.1 hypothetical protein C9374_012102 [Naegleria lovaniensis]
MSKRNAEEAFSVQNHHAPNQLHHDDDEDIYTHHQEGTAATMMEHKSGESEHDRFIPSSKRVKENNTCLVAHTTNADNCSSSNAMNDEDTAVDTMFSKISQSIDQYELVLRKIRVSQSGVGNILYRDLKRLGQGAISKLREDLERSHGKLVQLLNEQTQSSKKNETEMNQSDVNYIDKNLNQVLPPDLLSYIFSFSLFFDFIRISHTCKLWRNICLTKAEALTAFDISDDVSFINGLFLFNRFIEWRIENIRHVSIYVDVFAKCGHKFNAVRKIDAFIQHSNMAGYPNIERVKKLYTRQFTFFGNITLPGLEFLQFKSFKDAIIDFFHLSMFGLALVDTLLPMLDFTKIDRIQLISNFRLLASFIRFQQDTDPSKAGSREKIKTFLTNINDHVKYLILTAKDDDEYEEEEGEGTTESSPDEFHLASLEKLTVKVGSSKLFKMLKFNPAKLKSCTIVNWLAKHTVDASEMSTKSEEERLEITEFHSMLDRLCNVSCLRLEYVPFIFFKSYSFEKFTNLKSLKVLEIEGEVIERLAPKLTSLKVQRISNFTPQLIENCTKLKHLVLGSRFLVDVDIQKLKTLKKLHILSSQKHKLSKFKIESPTIEVFLCYADIRSLEVTCPNLYRIHCANSSPIEELTIKTNKLQHFTVEDTTINSLSILSYPIPNQTAEQVSPLIRAAFLDYVQVCKQLECPYLRCISISNMEVLKNMITLSQTPLLVNIVVTETILDTSLLIQALKTFPIETISISNCSTTECTDNSLMDLDRVQLKEIHVKECDFGVSKFIVEAFSKFENIDTLAIQDCYLDPEFVRSICQPTENEWKNLQSLEVDICANLSGDELCTLYSNIEHYEHLKNLSLLIYPDRETESLHHARFPQTLEMFNGTFNTLEIVPSKSVSSPNACHLKTLIIQPCPSSKFFNVNSLFQALNDLFVVGGDKDDENSSEHSPLFESQLENIFTDDVHELDVEAPRMSLLTRVMKNLPSLRYVSKSFFIDEPVDLVSSRPDIKFQED